MWKRYPLSDLYIMNPSYDHPSRPTNRPTKLPTEQNQVSTNDLIKYVCVHFPSRPSSNISLQIAKRPITVPYRINNHHNILCDFFRFQHNLLRIMYHLYIHQRIISFLTSFFWFVFRIWWFASAHSARFIKLYFFIKSFVRIAFAWFLPLLVAIPWHTTTFRTVI